MKLLDHILPARDIELAHTLAGKISLSYPPNVEAKLKVQGGRKRLAGVLGPILEDITKYQTEEKMGWIRKARFGNEFRWKLAEIGYTEAFVEALTEGVVTHLSTCLKNPSGKTE